MRRRRPISETPPSHVVDVPVSETGRAPPSPLAKAWRWFFVVRVGVLLAVLGLVSIWAITDYAGRQERLEWERPLDVALVLIQQGKLAPGVVRKFRKRIPALERQLEREFSKYRQTSVPPVRLFLYGPVVAPPPSSPSTSPSPLDQFLTAIERRLDAAKIDRLAGKPPFGFDSTIYLTVRPPTTPQRFVEGFGEQGGRHGFVDVQLDAGMIDFALFVAVHELFHTLGASDKYDATGGTLLPRGLADPHQTPRFPQHQADVMAHGVSLDAHRVRPPENLQELAVGPATAAELHWR